MINILLIDTDPSLCLILSQTLREHQYHTIATTASAALERVKQNSYAAIVVDVTQPESQGIGLCVQLRSLGYQNPILLLIETDEEAIEGFEAGADDYIQKPVDLNLLLHKMRTWLRRRGGIAVTSVVQSHYPQDQQLQTISRWGDLSLDWAAARVTWQAQEIILTSTEYKLLELLLRNPQRIFSRSAILDRLWDAEAPTERAINTYVKDIRKKLKTAGMTDEIIETVYGMGYRLKPCPADHSHSINAANPTIVALTQEFRERLPHRLQILAEANLALQDDTLNSILRGLAQQEAHKLAGSLASFGYPKGSSLAQSLEHLLRLDREWSVAEREEFAQRFTALQQELDLDPQPTSHLNPRVQRVQPGGMDLVQESPLPVALPKQNYWLLVIDDDIALTDRLVAEGAAWGLGVEVVPNPAGARSYLEQRIPDAVLLDLSFPGAEEDGLLFLQYLWHSFPRIPVVVFTGRNSLNDRLAVSRLGAKGFLHKPATIFQIFEKVQQVLPQNSTREAKVLIVDDDVETLSLLTTLLTPWGLTIVTLMEPERFWDVLRETRPAVVLLDLEMPAVSGLELCQVVRQDGEWGDLPLLVVTAHTEARYLQQAFAAGADDFITKPVLGAELVTRVLSRIKFHG